METIKKFDDKAGKYYWNGKAQAFSQIWEYIVFDKKSVGNGITPEEYNKANEEWSKMISKEVSKIDIVNTKKELAGVEKIYDDDLDESYKEKLMLDLLPINISDTPIEKTEIGEYYLRIPIHPINDRIKLGALALDWTYVFFKNEVSAIVFYLLTKDKLQFINLTKKEVDKCG